MIIQILIKSSIKTILYKYIFKPIQTNYIVKAFSSGVDTECAFFQVMKCG